MIDMRAMTPVKRNIALDWIGYQFFSASFVQTNQVCVYKVD